jgi:excisionase family DNA binding protein
MREIPLSELGLISVADAAARMGCTVRSVQRWIALGNLAAAVAASGNRRTYLLRIADVDAFQVRPVGRPRKELPTKAAGRKPRTGRK